MVFTSLAVLAGLLAPPALQAQRFPNLGGIDLRVGVVDPDNAGRGFSAAADLDLGYIGTPWLRTIAGVNYWTANVNRTDVTGGSFNGIGGRVGLRLDLLPTGSISPYVFAAVAGYNVDASLEGTNSAQLERDLGGFNVGGMVGGGIGYALDEARRTRVIGEFSQLFINNFDQWGVSLGIRYTLRGRGAYDPVFRYRDTFWDPQGTQAAVEAERARLERERLERERLERERQAADDAARRLEQERLARMTDEERRRAQQETEEARRRAEQEAAARVGAEAEAARAREEAERARTEAAEAQRRAREAEEQLYQSLLDLDRLIANVTEIRETERGLSIVLGQGLFAVGQSALSPRARDEVGRIAAVLAQFPQHRIAVEGHTDSTGSAEMNQRLSEQRASSVRAALVAAGIDPGRIDMMGRGQDLPIADNATAAGRAQNRRVEIVLLGARRPAAAVN